MVDTPGTLVSPKRIPLAERIKALFDAYDHKGARIEELQLEVKKVDKHVDQLQNEAAENAKSHQDEINKLAQTHQDAMATSHGQWKKLKDKNESLQKEIDEADALLDSISKRSQEEAQAGTSAE